MPKINDRTGKRYGRLLVLNQAVNIGRRVSWNCRCDCGNVCIAKGDALTSGDKQSCGCIFREWVESGDASRTHGCKNTPEYKVWDSIKQRCLNSNSPNYHLYGARGITICERWRSSFENFLADVGLRPSENLSIERIDNNGPYAPWNCKWATREEQANNQRTNRILEHDGEKMTMARWARRFGVNYKTFKWYIRRGDTLAQIEERVSALR